MKFFQERIELLLFMMNTVSEINKAVCDDLASFIAQSEANYNREVESIADHIARNRHLKLIMLAGPSGSGKTTSAHILKESLKKFGLSSQVISLDDFYLSERDLPLLSDGERDTESVYALDIDLMKRCFENIIKTGKSRMPRFDFEQKKSIKDAYEFDATDSVIIVEGLHALNPLITDSLPNDSFYKIYVSVNESIFDDEGDELLSSRKIRLMRRVLRDERFRNTDIKTTLKMWIKVIEGEEKYLYPFKSVADKLLVTLHPYEVCVYRKHFIEAVSKLDGETFNYADAIYTMNAVTGFCDIDFSAVPTDSLIREFIGDGQFNY